MSAELAYIHVAVIILMHFRCHVRHLAASFHTHMSIALQWGYESVCFLAQCSFLHRRAGLNKARAKGQAGRFGTPWQLTSQLPTLNFWRVPMGACPGLYGKYYTYMYIQIVLAWLWLLGNNFCSCCQLVKVMFKLTIEIYFTGTDQ